MHKAQACREAFALILRRSIPVTRVTDSHLSPRDLLLALAVVFVWGSNFVVIKLGLDALPPLLFASLRFTFVLLPLVFFLPRPKVAWRNLILYGTAIGLGQFGLLFIAMDGLISPGLASLVVQMQVFFTIALSMLRSGERLKPYQLGAFALAIAGMAVIMAHNGRGATIAGVVLTVGAAAGWALANQTSKEAGKVNALAYVVWSSLFSLPPLYLLSLWREGWPAIATGLEHATLGTWAVILWQSVGNTMFGYGCWAWLLARYPAATVSPLTLLVPVFGMGASALLLGEPLQDWKILAGLLVMAGLAVNLFWARRGRAADKTVRWTVLSGERRERERAAGPVPGQNAP
ncbi:MAG: EamA family transporter [Alphaproteobacteria bacterium]|nr:EamA family transporter [Alphaproteobacteria bacterium]